MREQLGTNKKQQVTVLYFNIKEENAKVPVKMRILLAFYTFCPTKRFPTQLLTLAILYSCANEKDRCMEEHISQRNVDEIFVTKQFGKNWPF